MQRIRQLNAFDFQTEFFIESLNINPNLLRYALIDEMKLLTLPVLYIFHNFLNRNAIKSELQLNSQFKFFNDAYFISFIDLKTCKS